MEIFDFNDYREFVVKWVQARPKGGHGQYRKMALHLRIAPVTISQIFKGDRELSLEAALPLADFLKLGALEKRYFLKLVLFGHATSPALKKHLQEEIDQIKKESQNLKHRVPSHIELSEASLATFHSSWIYSAVRLLTSIDEMQTRDAIAARLELTIEKTEMVLNFLVECGLCVRENEKYKFGPSRTHLPKDSPFIIPRQLTWRNKAATLMDRQDAEDLFYTAPMSLARKDIPAVRKILIQAIEQVNAVVGPSRAEELVCLNMDWFRVD